MRITKESLREKLGDLEKKYVDFMVGHFGAWKQWADASQKMADGKAVAREDIPEVFQSEYEFARAVLDMEHQGGFNWNDPRIKKLFGTIAQSPFYTFWADMITETVLRIAGLFEIKTLLEAGAGRANLTSPMLQKLAEKNIAIPLVTTDAHPVVLENIGKLRQQYPGIRQQTCLWDITQPPSGELLGMLEHPVLLYERATITYANWKAIENFAQAADILVLGDYFNYTGELYAYDFIFDKIGVKPLLYREVKPVLDACFPNQYLLDQRVVEKINLPNVSLCIAWK